MQEVMEAPTSQDTELESALAQAQQDAERALEAVGRLAKALKAAQVAARDGDLKALHKAHENVVEGLQKASDTVQHMQEGWTLSEGDEEAWLASGAYTRELLSMAQQSGISLFEQETFLACYPSLVKIQPKDRSVLIDRKVHRQIRPSHLVAHLAKIQKKTPKLNLGAFLETLHAAWQLLNRGRGGVEKLVDLYKALTLLPTVRQDYSLQEFARDVYLLDGGGSTTTKDGKQYRLDPGATGAKNRSNLLIVVTREGVERTYYGIEFLG